MHCSKAYFCFNSVFFLDEGYSINITFILLPIAYNIQKLCEEFSRLENILQKVQQ